MSVDSVVFPPHISPMSVDSVVFMLRISDCINTN